MNATPTDTQVTQTLTPPKARCCHLIDGHQVSCGEENDILLLVHGCNHPDCWTHMCRQHVGEYIGGCVAPERIGPFETIVFEQDEHGDFPDE